MENGVLQQLQFRLSYGECDPAGIVYFGSYHPWMERAYLEWSWANDLRTDVLTDERGIVLASRASTVSYERSPRVYDPVRCEMRLARIGTTSFTLRHDFVHPDTCKRWALGLMTMVTMDVAERRPIAVPDWFTTHLLAAGPAAGTDP